MQTSAIEKHLVTTGDYNMVAAGQTLFDCPNCKSGVGGKIFYNGAPGQLVAYTISATTLQPITVDNTTVASVTGPLYVGVFVDEDGDGAADNVRLIAGEHIDNCLIDEASVSAPVCGQPQILASYIDCVNCGEAYTAWFRYSDNRTRSFGLTRADQEEMTASFTIDCNACSDCPQEANEDQVLCNIVDSLNGEFQWKINGEDYPDRIGDYRPKPFRAVVLHQYWRVFCLNPQAAACEGCDAVSKIESAIINGTRVTFNGNLNPADATETLLPQLRNIAQQIECGFEDQIGPKAGFAFVSGGGPDSCCPLQLHVVSCDATFELEASAGVPIDACDLINPFPTFTDDVSCVNCPPAAASTFTPTKGIAVIIEQPDFTCSEYVDKPLAFYGRTGELTFIKDAGDFSPTIKATELLEPRLPENFGAWIKWLEYQQETGGKGRTFRDVNAPQGWLSRPDSVSRARNAITFADCGKSYCSYYIGHSMKRDSLTKSPAFNRLQSYIHIPSTDFNTIADWEAFYSALVAASGNACTVLSELSCGTNPGSPAYTPTYTPTYIPTYTPTYTPT